MESAEKGAVSFLVTNNTWVNMAYVQTIMRYWDGLTYFRLGGDSVSLRLAFEDVMKLDLTNTEMLAYERREILSRIEEKIGADICWGQSFEASFAELQAKAEEAKSAYEEELQVRNEEKENELRALEEQKVELHNDIVKLERQRAKLQEDLEKLAKDVKDVSQLPRAGGVSFLK